LHVQFHEGWRSVHPIDRRMLSFVAWHGEIPAEATRLDEFSARAHAAPWIRRTIGRGVASNDVIGYELAGRWWTLFFERDATSAPEGAEAWWVEAYNHDGKGWANRYCYWPAEHRWRHALHAQHGDDYGRFASQIR